MPQAEQGTPGTGTMAGHAPDLAARPDALPAPATARHSRLVQRLRRRYAQDLPLLAPGQPSGASMATGLTALRERGHDSATALRILRGLVMERLVVRDCEQGAPLEAVTQTMTELAELALDVACTEAFGELDQRHGAPLTARGERVRFWVVGMGKLGGRELNVSSDIDLVYVYDQDGHTRGGADGGGAISAHEYFTRAARLMYGLISDITEHGFVFRIDLALRPNGNSGAAVCSLEALKEYMLVQGREWERFAWIKSRVVAPQAAIADGSARALRSAVLPFVFRKYLDYNVFDALRALHEQIRSHTVRRSAGRPARAGDVKLSRGGIREIEFTVQLPQLVRGGQFPELRTRSTVVALDRLAQADLIPAPTADALRDAYTFLRRVEHRIQYLDDQQTHVLPTDDADLHWIARTLGLNDASALLARLCEHRETVAEQFNQILGEQKTCKRCGAATRQDPPDDAAQTGLAWVESLLGNPTVRRRLAAWRNQPRMQELQPRRLERLTQLMARTAGWLGEGRVSETAVLRFIDWVDSLLGRENYLALLVERPVVHERVLHVLATARWPARYLLQHPAVIDELASPNLLAGRFDATALERELEERRAALMRTREDHEENLLNLLRRAQHAEVLRTLLRDLERRITVEQVADDLSALADVILRVAMRWCWPLLRRRHRAQPRLGIIGYGKLGGKELAYGSDLDLVFVFDDDDESAPPIYAAFVRKLISWLTAKTAEGDLYEIDTALRPNGHAGLLVTGFDAYANYQQRRGSNTAWTWEHQAMTRARLIPPRSTPSAEHPAHEQPFDLTDRFNAVRHAVITAPRDTDALHREIVAMRQKISAAHPVRAGLFDVKHSIGGMVDVEFAIQYLVLAHSHEHAEMTRNLGNIALLLHAEHAGLLPTGIGRAAASAYRTLRHVQHRARLDERPTQVAPATLARERAAIDTLWQAVFGVPRDRPRLRRA